MKRATVAKMTAGLMLLTCCLLTAGINAEKQPEKVEHFYFLGPHLFPFKHGMVGLAPRDMNGDGKTDLILLDNRASKFQLLLQKPEDAELREEEPEEEETEVNELEADRLLAKEEVRINELLLAFTVGHFGGHDAAIVYFTHGKELVVDRREEKNSRENLQRFLLDLDSTFCGGFERADLDGNGKDDLVFLGEDAVLVFLQDEEGKLAAPRHYPVAKEKSGGLVLADVNNDGRPDLIYRAPATRYPLRVRLTQPDGSPGPEYRFRMPAPRHLAVGDCTGDGRNEIALIESTTNRIKLLRWEVKEKGALEGTEAGALKMVPFLKDQKAKLRSYVIADVDGDGLPDIVVTEPDAARMSLIRSEEGTGLRPPESFPSLQEASGLAVMAAPDGSTELILCSKKEGIVGVSRYDAETGRLEYPKPISIPGKPHSIAVGLKRGNGQPLLYCAVRRIPAEGAKDKGPVELVTLKRTEAGFEVLGQQTFDKLKEPPAGLLPVDANGDGLTDLLAFPEYEPPMLLIQDEEGQFEIVSERPGFHKHMLRDLKASAVDTAPLPAGVGPEADAEGRVALFLGNRNLARAVRYDGANLVVEDQFSNPNARSSYVALDAADLNGDGEVEILAADHTSKWLSILERDEKGVYQVARNIEIGPFEILGLETTDIEGDGSLEVLIVGQEKLGVLFLSKGGPELREIAAFETDQKNTHYGQIVIADLNADGKNDLLLREAQKHQLEILYRRPDGEWKRGMRFKVFEGRLFDRRQAPVQEPREMVTAELTGDGLTDIAIIVHDRVIIYPQQNLAAPRE